MAIVKMKRLRVIALAGQREELLSRLLHVGCVELSEPRAELSDPEWTALLGRSESTLSDAKEGLARVSAALQTLNKQVPAKGGMFQTRKPIREGEFLSQEALERALAKAEEINSREREIGSILNQESRLEARRLTLKPWAPLDVDLGITSTKHVKIALAACPAGVDMGSLMAELSQAAPSSQVVEASTDQEQHYFLYLCHLSEEPAVQATLKSYGVAPAGPKDVTGTAAENLAALEKESKELEARRVALEQEIAALADCRSQLEVCTDRLRQEISKQEAAQRTLTDGTIVFLNGWVTEEGLPAVRAELEKFSCAWEAQTPTPEEYPEVPVKLKNHPLVKPLNMITDMYVYPAYDGLDPNPLMAPFFIFFFGMMMADMAYGLMMLAGGWFLLKKLHARGTMANMGGLLLLCGVSTLVFGALTGSFLGDFFPQLMKIIDPASTFALPALFTPLNDTLAILLGSLILGAIQVVTGMVISVVYKLRRGEVLDALFDEISWWVILSGAALAILGIGSVGGVPLVLVIGFLMLAIGGTREAKGFGKVTKLIGLVYNGVSGYFSDILSYARLMALMLASAVIAQVFNTLGAVTGNVIGFIIISLIGNVLNFALNLLGCYVHDLRLQCLEYFNRFYKEGGRPFRPLVFDTQYVDIIKEEN